MTRNIRYYLKEGHMEKKYSLEVKHSGIETDDFCVYETNDHQEEDIRCQVWFSKMAHPGTKVEYQSTDTDSNQKGRN